MKRELVSVDTFVVLSLCFCLSCFIIHPLIFPPIVSPGCLVFVFIPSSSIKLVCVWVCYYLFYFKGLLSRVCDVQFCFCLISYDCFQLCTHASPLLLITLLCMYCLHVALLFVMSSLTAWPASGCQSVHSVTAVPLMSSWFVSINKGCDFKFSWILHNDWKLCRLEWKRV